ncbi:hypothetical protein RCL_jg2401.t1 [Rhizophagus clarus]|uniref:Uncharacterized protein n=1 Tax=Rhizophagus clarus TaxID=94130 RepID=A0A8H3LRQ3_9GLOM|nr:hypothetical protein RCL_jg2401.t1 [Rhizophagus clarus]
MRTLRTTTSPTLIKSNMVSSYTCNDVIMETTELRNMKGGLLGISNISLSLNPNNHHLEYTNIKQIDKEIDTFLARNRLEFEEQYRSTTIYDNFYLNLNIATYNINGCSINNTNYKLKAILCYIRSHRIDILTLIETNLDLTTGDLLFLSISNDHCHVFFGNK